MQQCHTSQPFLINATFNRGRILHNGIIVPLVSSNFYLFLKDDYCRNLYLTCTMRAISEKLGEDHIDYRRS
jgi:hypothetical protein